MVPFYRFFFGGGLLYSDRLQKQVGTLILTSLLEDVVEQCVEEAPLGGSPRFGELSPIYCPFLTFCCQNKGFPLWESGLQFHFPKVAKGMSFMTFGRRINPDLQWCNSFFVLVMSLFIFKQYKHQCPCPLFSHWVNQSCESQVCVSERGCQSALLDDYFRALRPSFCCKVGLYKPWEFMLFWVARW